MSSSDTEVDGAILECAFTSIPDMVKVLYAHPLLPYHHMGPLVWDRFDALAALSGGAARGIPLLFVRSEQDELVPPEMTQRLFDAAVKGSKGEEERKMVTVPAALHDTGYLRPAWREEIGAFVTRCWERKKGPVQD
jgi:fermentation-respiration switch protein FrsA (DUF1100 family)